MMNIQECANAWKTVCNCYDETRDTNPEITMDKIVESIGMNRAKEVFATITKIKSHDGRISGYNRKKLEDIPVNAECLKRTDENPMFCSELDHIHTAHIDNLISQLLKRCKLYEEVANISKDDVCINGKILDNEKKVVGHYGYIAVSLDLLKKLENEKNENLLLNKYLFLRTYENGHIDISLFVATSTYAPISSYIESEFVDLITNKVAEILK